MIPAGLSLEQAPPFGVPLRFFLTAPPFLLLAAGLMVWQGPDLFASRWLPATLALTHLLTLGFMAQVMLGAAYALNDRTSFFGELRYFDAGSVAMPGGGGTLSTPLGPRPDLGPPGSDAACQFANDEAPEPSGNDDEDDQDG